MRRLTLHLALTALPVALLWPVSPAWHPAGPAVRAAGMATPDSGPSQPEPFPQRKRQKHLAGLGVDRWHAQGWTGRGVKVAVLDTGFRGYRDHLGKALPAGVKVKSFRRDGNLEARNSQHGILCAEVVHALAPDAELLFANWEPDTPTSFLAAVRWARDEGAKVITCSVIMPGWSDGHGGGSAHESLSKIVGRGDGKDDLLCFASAGNIAQRHWCGTFCDCGEGLHVWQAGRTDNMLTPWEGTPVSVELTHPKGATYELHVRDVEDGSEVGAVCRLPAQGVQGRAVRFTPASGHRYAIRVERTNGEPGPIRVVALGGGLDFYTTKSSIAFPADGPEVLAVGAVNAAGRRLGYSSCGPVALCPKPDFVAPVPFPSLCRAAPFTGTSAAAPQAAALAALWWSRYPDWKAGRVREALGKACRDLGEPGHDCETGHGLIGLPREGR